MKSTFLLIVVIMILVGCAPYAQLDPNPVLSSTEDGFKPVLDKKNHFEIKGGNKYVVHFPSAQTQKFFLVVKHDKKLISSYFTDSYSGKKGRGSEIVDEGDDSISVYPLNSQGAFYYWMIDNVAAKKSPLKAEYRYVPAWRYKFETQYESFKNILVKNIVNKSSYESMGPDFDFNRFDFKKEIASLSQTYPTLKHLYTGVLAIETLFPLDINITDSAVINYRGLRDQLEKELEFQDNDLLCSYYFDKVLRGRAPIETIIKSSDSLNLLFNSEKIPSAIKSRASLTLGERENEFLLYFESIISQMRDADPIDSSLISQLHKTMHLLGTSRVNMSGKFKTMFEFTKSYQNALPLLTRAASVTSECDIRVKSIQGMPQNGFYVSLSQEIEGLRNEFSSPIAQQYPDYRAFRCVQLLDNKLRNTYAVVEGLSQGYSTAASLVPKLNELYSLQNYPGMLSLLKQYPQLTFLTKNYKQVDSLSLTHQAASIKNALNANNWLETESLMQILYADQFFLDLTAITPVKLELLQNLELALLTAVERESMSRAKTFVAANLNKIDNIENMYNDEVFKPLHVVRFTVGDVPSLQRKNQQIIDALGELRDVEMPEAAIKALYESLSVNPDDKGVLKARAIVSHGKLYKGKDKQIINRVHECDPSVAKWITKPMQYRRVFALPITNDKKENVYVVRLNIQISSEAQFPVYDVNIKLPKTVAQNAAAEQWYEEISINKNVIKNEGRFTITAPDASNDYECQITPVRMQKDENNILEIRFRHASNTILPLSVMAQKPLIKKN